jgi:hypothetical protein
MHKALTSLAEEACAQGRHDYRAVVVDHVVVRGMDGKDSTTKAPLRESKCIYCKEPEPASQPEQTSG